MDEESTQLAVTQRLRTLAVYAALSRGRHSVHVLLHSGETVRAERVLAVDSAESKLCVSGLQTSWGVFPRAVLRLGDVVSIHIDEPEALEEGELPD